MAEWPETFQRLLNSLRKSQRYIQDGWVVIGRQNSYRDSHRFSEVLNGYMDSQRYSRGKCMAIWRGRALS